MTSPPPTSEAQLFLRDGFSGERMSILPRPRVEDALRNPVTAGLVVTDCGYFPNAQHHGRTRRRGIPQAVILICAKGSGWVQVDGDGPLELHAGEAAILPAGRPHAYAASESASWTLWWLHVQGIDNSSSMALLRSNPNEIVRKMVDPVRVASLASEVLTWHERDTTDASLVLTAGVASHLLALVSAQQLPGPGVQSAVERVAVHLRTTVTTHGSVESLAAMAGLSRPYFAALFKRQFGVSVLQYQTQVRMQRARELLDTTEAPIERIAGLVGYDDAVYFARVFKKVHGVSPRQYRKHEKG